MYYIYIYHRCCSYRVWVQFCRLDLLGINCSLSLLISCPLPHYSHRTIRWGDRRRKKKGSEEGVIGVHALCIISYSEEDNAVSGNESSRQCTGVNTVNANEGAAFAGRYIWLKVLVMVNTAQWCYQPKHTESKGRCIEKEMSLRGIFGSVGDKRSDYWYKSWVIDVEDEKKT